VSTLLASYALHRAWISRDPHGDNPKPPAPVVARHEVSAPQPAPQPVYPQPFEDIQPMDPRSEAALATGSHPRSRATTFTSDTEPRLARAEKRSAARRVHEHETQLVGGAGAPNDMQLQAAKTDERELLAAAVPTPAEQLQVPAKRSAATPPSFAESAAAEPRPAPETPAPAAASATRAKDAAGDGATAAQTPPPTRGVTIDDVRVRGSLSPSVVRRALDRIRPLLHRCVQQHASSSATHAIQLSTTIDEIGRTRDSAAHGNAPAALNDCMVAATAKIVADTPDTGTVKVSWKVEY
jgi:hypothetical protein